MPTSRSRSSQDTLQRAGLAFDVLASLGDGALGIPGLKSAALITKQIIDVALAVKANADDAIVVAQRTCDIMMVLIHATQNKTEEDMRADFKENLVRFGKDLEAIQRIMSIQSTSARLLRVWKYKKYQQEIAECKEMIDHAFKVFQVFGTVNTGVQIESIWRKLHGMQSTKDEAENEDPNLANLKEIPLNTVDLTNFTQDPDIQYGSHDGKVVVVKRFKDEASWLCDIETWQKHWQPYLLQVQGRSRRKAPHYLVLRDPGTPMQTYVRKQFGENPRAALLNIVTVIRALSDAAKYLADPQRAGCRIENANIHIRSEGCPVFINFYPNEFYSGSVATENETWGAFLHLLAKSITGDPAKPNYTLGHYGGTGACATRMSRFLLHFLWDFRFRHSKRLQIEHDNESSLGSLYGKLSAAMELVQKDIETAPVEDNNPLLSSLQSRFSSRLCGIWDVWEPLSVHPGDIGVLRGSHHERPKFQRFTNVADQISDVYREHHELTYEPDPSLWSEDVLPNGMIRHTLRLKDAEISSKLFKFSRGQEFSNLDRNWDNTAAWAYLRDNRPYLEELAKKHKVDVYDLCLVFSYSKSKQHTKLTLKCGDTISERDGVLQAAGFKNGILYYFENAWAEEGHVQGYWSSSSDPGQPLWPPSPDVLGPSWAWEYSNDSFYVENSRKGPVEHIRYLTV